MKVGRRCKDPTIVQLIAVLSLFHLERRGAAQDLRQFARGIRPEMLDNDDGPWKVRRKAREKLAQCTDSTGRSGDTNHELNCVFGAAFHARSIVSAPAMGWKHTEY